MWREYAKIGAVMIVANDDVLHDDHQMRPYMTMLNLYFVLVALQV